MAACHCTLIGQGLQGSQVKQVFIAGLRLLVNLDVVNLRTGCSPDLLSHSNEKGVYPPLPSRHDDFFDVMGGQSFAQHLPVFGGSCFLGFPKMRLQDRPGLLL